VSIAPRATRSPTTEMAKRSTERRCPYCADMIKLGDCPIVATNFRGAEYLPGPKQKLSEIQLPSRVTPERSLETGWPVVAEAPNETRGGISRALGSLAENPSLPSLFEVAEREDVPARACPRCELPLPQSIDDRPAVVIGVVGVNRVGKTHLLASCLTQATRKRGLARIGCGDFTLDESTSKRFRERYYEPLFRHGLVLRKTLSDADAEKVRFRPLICNGEMEGLGKFSLILHDVAGEIMADPNVRAERAPYLRGARGIIFVVDPREIDSLRDGIPSWVLDTNPIGFDQGALLSACLRPDGIVDQGELIPVAIALAKADLLPGATDGRLPFLAPAPAEESRGSFIKRIKATSKQVADFLEQQEAFDILDPARKYGQANGARRGGNGQVTFHAFSALGSAPDGEDNLQRKVEPLNCIDPLATVLAQVQLDVG